MISFQGKEYELFFSNDLEPLRALYFADEQFFEEFERLCGGRYRILSIIRNGKQEKYGRMDDLVKLASVFRSKIHSPEWVARILTGYEKSKKG